MNPFPSSPVASDAIQPARSPFPFRQVALLLAFLAATSLIGLGHPPLIDPDEPVYGEAGRLMAASKSFAAWWTPHYNGAMWFDKPPVTYWLVGLSMTLFGPSDFAARLPMALATLALVSVVARLAWRCYPGSPLTPLWAAVVFGTMAQTIQLSRSCVTDMLLTLCLTAALVGVWRWATEGGWRPMLGAGIAVGIGTMVKGPVALVLISGQILLYLLVTRQWRRLASPQLWGALLLAVVIAAPWYVGMVRLHGQFFIQSFLEAQNVTRYVKAEHVATSGAFLYVPILMLALLPWTFVFFPALVAAGRRSWTQLAAMRSAAASPATVSNQQSADLFAVLWVALVFVFFSASQTKLVTYIYPLYPLAACFMGYWIAESVNARASTALGIVMLLAVAAGYAGAAVFLSSRVSTLLIALLGAAALLIYWRASDSKQSGRETDVVRFFTRRLAVPGLALAALMPFGACSSYWRDPDPKGISAVRAARVAAIASAPGAPIYCLVFNKPSIVYYSHHHVFFTNRRKVVAALLVSQPAVVCVTKPDVIDTMAKRGILPPHTVLSTIRRKAVVIRGEPVMMRLH